MASSAILRLREGLNEIINNYGGIPSPLPLPWKETFPIFFAAKAALYVAMSVCWSVGRRTMTFDIS